MIIIPSNIFEHWRKTIRQGQENRHCHPSVPVSTLEGELNGIFVDKEERNYLA